MIFATPRIGTAELKVIEQVTDLRERLRHAVSERRRWTGQLRRQAFARAIRGSNSIEGYTVTLDDALAVIEGEEPLEAEKTTYQAVKGYRDALTYVLQLAGDPHFKYSSALLRALHFMMIQHDLEKSPGRYRAGPVFVYDEAQREVVYEGPTWDLVPGLTEELVDQLNGRDDDSALVRGAMAHLNLVMIHPFRDGNGRMGRALQTLVLGREGILAPEFCSIEEYLGRNTPEYYEILAQVGEGSWHPESDARPWIRFCLKAHLTQATTILYRVRLYERLWGEIEQVVTVEHGLPDRMVGPLFNAALGLRIRNATYRSVADVSPNVASRDLRILVDVGLIKGHGQKRGKHYTATEPILAAARKARGEKPVMTDPFAEERGQLMPL
jgi:Fic family protein